MRIGVNNPRKTEFLQTWNIFTVNFAGSGVHAELAS